MEVDAWSGCNSEWSKRMVYKILVIWNPIFVLDMFQITITFDYWLYLNRSRPAKRQHTSCHHSIQIIFCSYTKLISLSKGPSMFEERGIFTINASLVQGFPNKIHFCAGTKGQIQWTAEKANIVRMVLNAAIAQGHSCYISCKHQHPTSGTPLYHWNHSRNCPLYFSTLQIYITWNELEVRWQ